MNNKSCDGRAPHSADFGDRSKRYPHGHPPRQSLDGSARINGGDARGYARGAASLLPVVGASLAARHSGIIAGTRR